MAKRKSISRTRVEILTKMTLGVLWTFAHKYGYEPRDVKGAMIDALEGAHYTDYK